MDLIWLEDFLAIAEEGGFSRAAERRHVTQPALSRRIRALEEWLGTPLFERSTHTLTLTPAGETFRPVAEDVLRRVLVGREEALEVARLKAETIHFAATHALSQTFFPDWIRKAESASSGVAIQLVAANFAACEKLLLDAQSHFLLAHHHPSLATRLDSDRFQRIELDTDVLVPVSAPGARPDAGRGSRKQAAPRYALPGSAAAPLPFLAYHPGSGVGRIVGAFLAARESQLLARSEVLRADDAADRYGASGPRHHLGAAKPGARRSRERTPAARRRRGMEHRDQRLPVPLARPHDPCGRNVLERGAERKMGEEISGGFVAFEMTANRRGERRFFGRESSRSSHPTHCVFARRANH